MPTSAITTNATRLGGMALALIWMKLHQRGRFQELKGGRTILILWPIASLTYMKSSLPQQATGSALCCFRSTTQRIYPCLPFVC